MPKLYSLLYVEDDPGSQKVMRGLIEILDFPVHLTIFEDSVNFLQGVKSVSPVPDLFLLDIHISPKNGFEMLQVLRADESFANKIIVAVTASVMNEEVKKLKDAGFDGVLAKPLKFRDFPNLIKRILAGEHLWTVIR